MAWDKIFTNCISGKRLIFRIYEEHLQLNYRLTNNFQMTQLKKLSEDSSRHFSKEDMKIVNEQKKICPVSPAIRKCKSNHKELPLYTYQNEQK